MARPTVQGATLGPSTRAGRKALVRCLAAAQTVPVDDGHPGAAGHGGAADVTFPADGHEMLARYEGGIHKPVLLQDHLEGIYAGFLR